MNTDQLTALYEKLELKSRRGRGGDYPYVPWQDVADRMNTVFEGNWSSEVLSETSVNNGVVLRVRVTVIDKETNIAIYQEGYGGADMAGAEVGTLHKSAYSKALRDACKKWGPGLYTDDLDYTPTTTKTKVNPPSTGVQTKPPVKNVVLSPPPAVKNKAVSVKPAVSIPSVVIPSVATPPISKTVIHEKGSAIEKIAAATSIPGAQKPIIPSTETKVSLPPVSNGTTTIPPALGVTASIENSKINDVQMAALDGILELKDIDPMVLIKESFEYGKLDITNLPTKEELTYQQAVLVIKYGNEKFRK